MPLAADPAVVAQVHVHAAAARPGWGDVRSWRDHVPRAGSVQALCRQHGSAALSSTAVGTLSFVCVCVLQLCVSPAGNVCDLLTLHNSAPRGDGESVGDQTSHRVPVQSVAEAWVPLAARRVILISARVGGCA
jgi:hypothetical protein